MNGFRTFLDGEVRASTIARYYWCAEESRIKATVRSRPIGRKAKEPHYATSGREIHRTKEKRKQPERVQELWDHLLALGKLFRPLDKTDIYIHPDEFRVTKDFKVILVEHKTTSKNKVDFYSLGPALCQVRVYIYVLNGVLPQLGYRLYQGEKAHRVMFWRRGGKRTGQLVDTKWVPWHGDEQEIADEIREIFKVWRGEKESIPPAMWKCRSVCRQFNKIRCSIYQQFKWHDPKWRRRFGFK